ncbi:MAG: InlB B-repeat-containing protein, partial [Prevotellaceae bacterium]|nr:InlB B-repeat-containing protein [Prevotellaceae bacterium]
NSVTEIGGGYGYGVCEGCTALTSVVIGDGLKVISGYSFNSLGSLEYIELGTSVRGIGNNAFNGSETISKIVCRNPTPATFSDINNAFSSSIYPECTLYVPVGTSAAYKVADVWKNFVNITEDDPSAQYVVNYIVADTVYHSANATAGGNIPAALSPERLGYTFSGWDGMPENGKMPANNLTLTAKWTINQYTITFDSDGGSVIEPITQNYGTEITAPAAPVKEGHTFVCWSPAIPETMPAQDITVVAQWEDHRYTLTYMLDDDKLLVENIPYGEVVVAPVPAQRLGCEFGGWEGLPSTMPANDVTVYGYNNVVDKDTVALDGHLTERMMAQIRGLENVKVLNLEGVTNSTLIVGGLNSLEKAC